MFKDAVPNNDGNPFLSIPKLHTENVRMIRLCSNFFVDLLSVFRMEGVEKSNKDDMHSILNMPNHLLFGKRINMIMAE